MSTLRSPRMFDAQETDAVEGMRALEAGQVAVDLGMTLAALIGGPIYFTWGALALFLATTAVDRVPRAIRSACTGA